MNENRKGFIRVADALLHDKHGERILQKIYSQILPIEVTHNPYTFEFDILGISYGKDFEVLLKGETIPDYKVWYDDLKDEVWFERLEVEDEDESQLRNV